MASTGNEFIQVEQALGFESTLPETRYDEKDLVLYALGVGAGPDELSVVYERNESGFYALPTFGVVPALNALFQTVMEGHTVPGLNYGLERILHGEQSLELCRPLPTSAKLKHRSRISQILDKGKNAVVVTHIDTFDAESGELLVKNDVSMVVRGAGGWGGDRGPSGEAQQVPDRAPDAVATMKTAPQQALLYRLSGDWNPLHADPQFAALFGFERPVLHGLCTFGFAGRAVINALAQGDASALKTFHVRFADSMFPGETLRVEMWKVENRVVLRALAVERNKVVLSHGAISFF